MKLKLYLAFALVVAAPISGAAAEETRFTVDASAGITQFLFRRDQFRNPQFGTTGNAPQILSVRNQDTSYRLGLTYRINATWDLEAGWQDNGAIRVRGTAPTSVAGVETAFTTHIRQTIPSIGAAFTFPDAGALSYVARVGVSRWNNEYDNKGTAIVGMHDESGTSPYAEFDARWSFRPHITLGGNLGYQWGMQASKRLSGSVRYSF